MDSQASFKLLLIDDDEVDIMQFERALKKTGLVYNLQICKNAEETLEIISKEVFDCIFLIINCQVLMDCNCSRK